MIQRVFSAKYVQMKGKFNMKKLSLILAASILASSLVFTSCKQTQPNQEDTTPKDKVEEQQGTTDKKEPSSEKKDDTSTTPNPAPSTDALAFRVAQEKIADLLGKTDLDNQVLLTVNGLEMNASSVKYATVNCSSYYAPQGNPDEATQKTIDDEVEDYFKLNAAVISLAEKNGVGITEKDYQEIIVAQYEQLIGMYGDDIKEIIEAYTYMTPYAYFEAMLYNAYYDKLISAFYGMEGNAQDKAEIIEKAKSEMDGKYVRAKHILIQFPQDAEKDENGNIKDSAKAETLAKANSVLEKVKAGEDFDALIAEYGEDPGMTTNPDGYYFTTGEMVEPFEKSAFELEVGETSDLVETSYGYHILLKLPIAEDNKGFFDCAVYQNLAGDALTDVVRAEADSFTPEYAENFKEEQQKFLDEYYALTDSSQE